jgi:hypothetical protein
MIRKILTALAATAVALGVPAALVLGTPAPAQACFYIGATAEQPSCGGGDGSTYAVTATPSVTAPGEPITLRLVRTTDVGSSDVTPGSTFTISSGTCAANVCTPDATGTLTISARYTPLGGNASTTVSVLAPDHLVLDPPMAFVTAGQPVSYRVTRAAADGTTLGEVTARAALTIDGVPCPSAVCTATRAGELVVTATDGALTGSARIEVDHGSAASLVVRPDSYVFWNNASPVSFRVTAYDAQGNDVGDVTAASTFAVSPDGSCSGNLCSTATGGAHTVTATYGSLVGTVTLDATGPTPIVAPALPDGQVGAGYSASVLEYGDSSTRTQLDPASALPAGLALGQDGILSGVPTRAGTYSFSVIAVNANGSVNRSTTVTIAPGSPSATPEVSVRSTSVREGSARRTVVRVEVRLSAPSSTPVRVPWHTVNGTAVAGRDYVAARGTVTVPAGSLTATVTVSVIGDRVHERNETFRVVLGRPAGATLGTSRATVTVVNDD